MKPGPEVFPGSIARGSGNTGRNRERGTRKEFVEKDLVELVLLLPENLFYNATAPGIIFVINKNKKQKNEILMINASKLFKKGRPKNYLPEDKMKEIANIYLNWKEEEGISKIVPKEELIKNDYNLSPSRYVTQNDEDGTLPLEDVLILLKEAEEERRNADEKLKEILEEFRG